MSAHEDTKTYRGSSLEELLPQIREELGPDAVITRQREGIVGGIGGFFGKQLVEVEARAGAPARRPVVPPRAVAQAYDAPAEDGEPHDERDETLIDALIAQASPFADRLAAELEREAAQPAEERNQFVAEPFVPETFAPEPEPERPAARASAPEPQPQPAAADDDAAAIRATLELAGIPRTVVEAVLHEALVHLLPFSPDRPLVEHARRALVSHVKVARPRAARRRIALVGAHGAGKTLAAGKLCGAFARGGSRVCAVSLEPVRDAFELATVTRPFGVDIEIADSPEVLSLTMRKLRSADLVVADVPALDPSDPAQLRRVASLLATLKPTETHLVLPAGTTFEAARLLLLDVRRYARVNYLLVSHADEASAGPAVGLSLAERVPVSYVSSSPLAAAGIAPAEPEQLARMVLP